MSNEIAFRKPARSATSAAPTTPAAGPETSATAGCSAASASVATPPDDRITNGSYLRRGQEPPLREEAGAAQEHYANRVRDAFKDVGDSVGDVGQQLADWLAKQQQRDRGDE